MFMLFYWAFVACVLLTLIRVVVSAVRQTYLVPGRPGGRPSRWHQAVGWLMFLGGLAACGVAIVSLQNSLRGLLMVVVGLILGKWGEKVAGIKLADGSDPEIDFRAKDRKLSEKPPPQDVAPPKDPRNTGKAVLLLGGGAVLSAIGIFFGVGSWRATSGALRTGGKVIRMTDGGAPVVRYQIGGQTFEVTGSVASDPPSYSVGEKVTVLYRPDRFGDGRIHSFTELWLFPVAFGGMGTLIALFGAGALMTRSRRETVGDSAASPPAELEMRRVGDRPGQPTLSPEQWRQVKWFAWGMHAALTVFLVVWLAICGLIAVAAICSLLGVAPARLQFGGPADQLKWFALFAFGAMFVGVLFIRLCRGVIDRYLRQAEQLLS